MDKRGETTLSAEAARRQSPQREATNSKLATASESRRRAVEATARSDDRKTVKQLGHLVVRVDDTVPFFKLLSETFQLPVASLERAVTFLTEKKMLGSINEDQIRIAPEKICGLDLRLVSESYN